MLAIERRKLFLDTINERGIATVSALAKMGNVTEETVRRDLLLLEQEGHVIKTHGGAVPNESRLGDISAEIRQNMNLPLKTKIAVSAASLVRPGDTIFLDASTSALYLARSLKKCREVRVITNSLPIINELSHHPDIKLVSVGGQLSHSNQSFVGDAAQNLILDNYCASKIFFSCRGLSEEGEMFESDEAQTAVKRTMLRCAAERIMLCDSTKFGRIGHVKLGSLEKISTVITDRIPDVKWKRLLDHYHIKIVYC